MDKFLWDTYLKKNVNRNFGVRVGENSPRFCEICGKPLRSRRKYCSDCRPSYRDHPFEDDSY